MLLWLLLIVSTAYKKEWFNVTIATAAVSSDDKLHDLASHDISHQYHLFIGIARGVSRIFIKGFPSVRNHRNILQLALISYWQYKNLLVYTVICISWSYYVNVHRLWTLSYVSSYSYMQVHKAPSAHKACLI